MFKKLQNLLFEDEEDDIVNEEAQAGTQKIPAQPAPQPVQPQQVVRPAAAPVQQAAPAPQPVAAPVEPARPAMTKIDVTQPVPVQKAEEVKKPTLGLTVDDAPVEKKKPVRPAAVKPAAPAKKEVKEDATNYQFRPVISPIFGVDEKDVTSLKNTTNKIKNAKQPKKEVNVTPVLSPMYGITAEEPAPVKDEEEATTDLLSQINANAPAAKEDDIPEFSLDDILKVRDEEFADDDRPVKEEEAPIFPDLTFDDDDAPEVVDDNEDIPSDLPVDLPEEPAAPADDSNIDNTVIIKQQLFDDDEN